MSLAVVARPEVVGDIQEAYSWYETERVGLGEELLSELRQVLDRMAEHPTMYEEIKSGIRRAVLNRFPYLVIYRVMADTIEIISVIHGSRHDRHWKKRLSN
jgi:plasmid stabilization system protein ParE